MNMRESRQNYESLKLTYFELKNQNEITNMKFQEVNEESFNQKKEVIRLEKETRMQREVIEKLRNDFLEDSIKQSYTYETNLKERNYNTSGSKNLKSREVRDTRDIRDTKDNRDTRDRDTRDNRNLRDVRDNRVENNRFLNNKFNKGGSLRIKEPLHTSYGYMNNMNTEPYYNERLQTSPPERIERIERMERLERLEQSKSKSKSRERNEKYEKYDVYDRYDSKFENLPLNAKKNEKMLKKVNVTNKSYEDYNESRRINNQINKRKKREEYITSDMSMLPSQKIVFLEKEKKVNEAEGNLMDSQKEKDKVK